MVRVAVERSKLTTQPRFFLPEFFLKMWLLNSRESRLADPPWKTQSGLNLLFEQKRTTGGDRGQNFEKKLWTKISWSNFDTKNFRFFALIIVHWITHSVTFSFFCFRVTWPGNRVRKNLPIDFEIRIRNFERLYGLLYIKRKRVI